MSKKKVVKKPKPCWCPEQFPRCARCLWLGVAQKIGRTYQICPHLEAKKARVCRAQVELKEAQEHYQRVEKNLRQRLRQCVGDLNGEETA